MHLIVFYVATACRLPPTVSSSSPPRVLDNISNAYDTLKWHLNDDKGNVSPKLLIYVLYFVSSLACIHPCVKQGRLLKLLCWKVISDLLTLAITRLHVGIVSLHPSLDALEKMYGFGLGGNSHVLLHRILKRVYRMTNEVIMSSSISWQQRQESFLERFGRNVGCDRHLNRRI